MWSVGRVASQGVTHLSLRTQQQLEQLPVESNVEIKKEKHPNQTFDCLAFSVIHNTTW